MTAKVEGVLVTFSFILILESVVAEVAAVLLFRFVISDWTTKVSLANDSSVHHLLELFQRIELLWFLWAAFANMNMRM